MSASDPQVAHLAAELRGCVGRLRRRLTAEDAREAMPSLGAMSVLRTLDRHGAITMGELATWENVRPPSMSRTVRALEVEDYVRRVPHSADGRVTLIALTAAGHRILVADRDARDSWLARRLDELDASERDMLARAAALLDVLARVDEP